MLQAICLFVILLGTWLALSGHYSNFLIGAGILCALLCVILSIRMNRIDKARPIILLSWFIPIYWLWLVKEIISSSFEVAYRIWHPRLPIDPVFEQISASQKTEIGIVTYANSITLTPGTLCTDVNNQKMEVHALTHSLLDDLKTGKMDKSITKLEILRGTKK